MPILFKNATILTVNEENQVLTGAYVATQGERISYVGQQRPQGDFEREIDCRGKVLMPGLVNTHTHIPMTLMRGFAGGYDLQTWLNDYIFPTEEKLDGRTVYIASQLALAEMIASGTTSIGEMYYFCGDIAQAVAASGISANIARSVTIFSPTDRPEDYYACKDLEEFRRQWGGQGDDQIKAEVSIHAEYTSFLSPNLWSYLSGYAKQYGMGMQVHISETRSEHEACIGRHGKTPIQVLDGYGVWDTRSIAAHCVWVSDEDMALMSRKGISAALNPCSNLKLGSGIARVPALKQAGVNLTLGTDGASSNNSLNLFRELKLTATLHNGVTHDPMAVTPAEALRMATVNGGKALGRHTGVIAPGYLADIILLDFTRPNLLPCHDVVENVVYAANGSEVCLTMARGKILYENGTFTTLDLDKIRYEVEHYALPRLFG